MPLGTTHSYELLWKLIAVFADNDKICNLLKKIVTENNNLSQIENSREH